MFLIWFALAGLVVGFLRGGRIANLAALRLRGLWLIIVSAAIQSLIFPWGDAPPLIRVATQYLHIISYMPLLCFVYLNRRYWEIALAGAGIALNLVVILVNGGYMPVSPFALAQAGEAELASYLREHRTSGNVVLMDDETRLNFLGDVLFLPPAIPFSCAFSLGDLLIGAGIFSLLALRIAPKGNARRDDKSRRFFVELLEKLSQARSIPEIAETALKYALDIIPAAEAGSFLWWDPGTGSFRYVAAVGWDMEVLGKIRFPPEELLQHRAGPSDDVMIVRDPFEEHRRRGHKVLDQFPDDLSLPAAFISVPIKYKGEVAGYFTLDTWDGSFRPEDLEAMRDFKREIELAIALRLSQEELRESEARFRILVENAPDAIYITDFEGNILDCNPAASQQTGYSREELLRMNIMRDLACPEVAPPYEAINQRLRSGERVVFEERKCRKDGTPFYTEVALSPIIYRGREATISFNRDITWRKERERKSQELLDLSRALFLSRSDEEACEKAVDLCRGAIGARWCGIYLLRDCGYRLTASYFPDGERRDLPLTFPSEEEARRALGDGHVLIYPLSFGGERLGLFAAGIQGAVEPEKRALVELLSLQLSNVLQVIRYTRRLEVFADRLEKLHRAAVRLNQCTEETELFGVAVEILEGLLGFDRCVLALREGDFLVPVAHSSKVPSSMSRRFRLDEGVAGRTYREQRTFWGDDARKVPEARPVDPRIRAFISVPIGEFGNLQVVSMKEGAFSQEDVKLVEILAQQLVEALRRLRLAREIREQAVKDPLTGLYNRRYFDLFIALYPDRSEGKPLSLVILDLDGFKGVNDRYGHTVGDEVLVAVGALLRENTRSDDVVIRWGGDEFLILMPKTEAGEARGVVERLRGVVLSWRHPRHPEIRLGFTAGVAEWNPVEGGIDEALRIADEELYAKRGRRKTGDGLRGG